jgi:hypothetical protein
MRVAAGRHLEADPSRLGLGDVEAGAGQSIPYGPSHALIVVDNEDDRLLAHQDGLRNDHARSTGAATSGHPRRNRGGTDRAASERAPNFRPVRDGGDDKVGYARADETRSRLSRIDATQT